MTPGRPVHYQAPDEYQQVCQPDKHDDILHKKVQSQETYPATHRSLNHQPANGQQPVCKPGRQDGSWDWEAHLQHQARDQQM